MCAGPSAGAHQGKGRGYVHTCACGWGAHTLSAAPRSTCIMPAHRHTHTPSIPYAPSVSCTPSLPHNPSIPYTPSVSHKYPIRLYPLPAFPHPSPPASSPPIITPVAPLQGPLRPHPSLQRVHRRRHTTRSPPPTLQVHQRRARLARACEHVTKTATRRLLSILLTQCWGSLLAHFYTAQQQAALQELLQPQQQQPVVPLPPPPRTASNDLGPQGQRQQRQESSWTGSTSLLSELQEQVRLGRNGLPASLPFPTLALPTLHALHASPFPSLACLAPVALHRAPM